jgi:hypothetical protein
LGKRGFLGKAQADVYLVNSVYLVASGRFVRFCWGKLDNASFVANVGYEISRLGRDERDEGRDERGEVRHWERWVYGSRGMLGGGGVLVARVLK